MRKIVMEMIEIFKPDGIDWMDYLIDDKMNRLTFHHIIEARNGGKLIIQNGALITLDAHILLNHYEREDSLTYMWLNGIFTELNRTMKPPDYGYWSDLNKIYAKVKSKKLPSRSGRHNWKGLKRPFLLL